MDSHTGRNTLLYTATYTLLSTVSLYLRLYMIALTLLGSAIFTASLRKPHRSPAILAISILFLSPNPYRLIQQSARYINPSSLVTPLNTNITFPSREDFESQIYRMLPYKFDYLNWYTADYWPTPAEALRAGCEDCDGRAILACSILRGMGYHARVVVGLDHAWVEVKEGDEWVGILWPRPPGLLSFNDTHICHVGFLRELKIRLLPPLFYMDWLMTVGVSMWLSTCLLIASPDVKRGLKAFILGIAVYTPLTYLYSEVSHHVPILSTVLGLALSYASLRLVARLTGIT